MNETPQIADNRTEENRIAGTLGAFLFALAGGLVYFALWQVGFIAAICGAIAVICAMKGYKLFAKKESLYGVVTSVVVSVLVIAIAWYFCLAFDVYDAYKERGMRRARLKRWSRFWRRCSARTFSCGIRKLRSNT